MWPSMPCHNPVAECEDTTYSLVGDTEHATRHALQRTPVELSRFSTNRSRMRPMRLQKVKKQSASLSPVGKQAKQWHKQPKPCSSALKNEANEGVSCAYSLSKWDPT